MAEPWAHVGEPAAGFDTSWGDVPFLSPGMLAQARRAEAVERHREAREAEEARERAQERVDAWMWARAQELAARGVPFDLGRPETLAESPAEMAEKVFRVQDMEARRAEFQAAKEAGLVHLLNISAADMAVGEVVLEPEAEVGERKDDTALLRARQASMRARVYSTEGPVGKARAALRRWSRGGHQ